MWPLCATLAHCSASFYAVLGRSPFSTSASARSTCLMLDAKGYCTHTSLCYGTLHAGTPSQLQVRDEEAEDDQVESPELEKDDFLEDEFGDPGVVEVGDDVLNVVDVVEDDLVEEKC